MGAKFQPWRFFCKLCWCFSLFCSFFVKYILPGEEVFKSNIYFILDTSLIKQNNSIIFVLNCMYGIIFFILGILSLQTIYIHSDLDR